MLDVSEGQGTGDLWRLLNKCFLPKTLCFKIYSIRNTIVIVTSDTGQVHLSGKAEVWLLEQCWWNPVATPQIDAHRNAAGLVGFFPPARLAVYSSSHQNMVLTSKSLQRVWVVCFVKIVSVYLWLVCLACRLSTAELQGTETAPHYLWFELQVPWSTSL